MKDFNLKIKYIYKRYLLVSVLVIVLYSALRRYLDYELGVLPLKDNLLDYWFPVSLSVLTVIVWLRRPIKFLAFGKRHDNLFFVYQLLAALFITVPVVIAQFYLQASNSKLLEVGSPREIVQANHTTYYKTDSFYVERQLFGIYAVSRTEGRHLQRLAFTMYCVVPIAENDKRPIDIHTHTHWYAFKFTETMSNYASTDEKERQWNEFYRYSLKKAEQHNYSDFKYLQGLAFSNDRDGYLEAVKSIRNNNATNGLILLEPAKKTSRRNAGNTFAWIFGAFAIGAFLFFVMILIPSVNYSEYQRFIDKKTLSDDDLKYTLNLLIPRGNHFITAILIDINLLVFAGLVLSGVDVVSPTPNELLRFGANNRQLVLNGEYWRLVTSFFLHGGLMHLGVNLVALGIIGSILEPVMGRVRLLAAYIVSGIGASLASILCHENSVGVGASGAIFGWMGVMIALVLTKKDNRLGGAFLWILGFFGVLSLLFGLLGGIDNAAHIGGLLAGMAVGFVQIGFGGKRRKY